MNRHDAFREYDKNFVGRANELRWLDDHLFRRSSFTPIIVFGVSGVGKTALVKQWLASRRISDTPLWLDVTSNKDYEESINDIIQEIKDTEYPGSTIVVIDGSENWTEQQHQEVCRKIFNYKVVSSLIFTTRSRLKLERSEILELAPMSSIESTELLMKFLSDIITDETQLHDALNITSGYPLAISLLSQLLKGENSYLINSILSKPLYQLSNNIFVPNNEIIHAVTPIMISANESLVTSLKKQPSDLRKLEPREFEKLLAELLRDMGWEVELTKQTRDGGADILAYLNTGVGRLLCLVEAKHYRADRKVGVDLVRTLYGTLCDAQANSAMLVTSSSFSPDAREFQQKHQYQLTLRDYADVVTWILKYGDRSNDY